MVAEKYSKVTAIIGGERLEAVEKALAARHVAGVTISEVRGYGEYHNFYRKDMTSRHAQVEVFCLASQAEEVARCMVDAAHTGMAGDGIVAIIPVASLLNVRSKSAVDASPFDVAN